MKTKRALFTIALALTELHASAAVFTDWTRLDLANNIAFGTLDGVGVTFIGDSNLLYSEIDGSSTLFACTDFSPQLVHSDFIYFAGTPATRTYSFEFASPVRDPVIHLASLASQAIFSSPVTRLSGSSMFDVTGSTVNGADINGSSACGGTDTSGSIRLDGVFCSLSFSLHFASSIDGIYLQLGGTAIRQPQITVSRATNSVALSFLTDTGISYQVQYSPVLPATNWASLGLPIVGGGTTNTVSDSTSGSEARFYRVHILVCQ